MTSPSQRTTMRSPGNENHSTNCPYHKKPFILQSDATPSDQTAQPTIATSRSLSAATPRTSRVVSHKSACLMEGADVHNTLKDTKLLTYTADIERSPKVMSCAAQPSKKQSSQLDSMLLTKLPRELRDKIYREAVVEVNDILIRVTRCKTEDGERRRRLQIGHALMSVSKQTRLEVADFYSLENKFRITEDLLEKRAIGELSRLLTPWGERMTKLGVSQELVPGRDDFVKIKFSISASQGRVFLEPEGFKAHEVDLLVDSYQATRDYEAVSCSKMCFCKILLLTVESRNILSWMEGYVDLVLQSLAQPKTLPHCWTCAGRIMI